MITIPIPRAWLLTSNQRLHWREKAQRAYTIRYFAFLEGRKVAALVGRQRCTVTIEWPNHRRRDAANLHPSIKPAIDGLVQAGVLFDDSDKDLIGPDLRVSDALCHRDYAAVLHITFEPAP